MSILTGLVEQLRADNLRISQTLREYGSDWADIGSVDDAGQMTSFRSDMIAHLKGVLATNEAIIARYDAGER